MMQTLDKVQLKVQSFKQLVEAAVSVWHNCSLMGFPAIAFG